MTPTETYYLETARSELANAIADRVKEAERSLPASHLEHKEIRGIVAGVLRERGVDPRRKG